MKQILTIIPTLCLAVVLWLAPAQDSTAQWLRSKRSLEKEKQEKNKPKSDYQKVVEGERHRVAKGPLINLYATPEQKLFLELPVADLGRDFLVAATVTSTSNPQLALVGFKNSNPLHIRFTPKDSTVVMEVVNHQFYFDQKQHPHLAEAEALNFTNISLNSYKIHSYSPDSTSLLIDFTSFVLKDNPYFPIMNRSVGRYSVSAQADDALARIQQIKSFEDNATIQVERSFTVQLANSQGQKMLSDYPTTISAQFTLLALPEVPMIPRISDTRVGVFQNPKTHSDPETGKIDKVTFVNRWRVEPEDPQKYFAGTPTKVVKPIVFYVDSAFPEGWKQPIKDGILRWNKAFEKIGLLDVVEARDFPTDDPEFDPDNLKYSCIRYSPIAIENAMGPSWIDPRTGEIINASVFVYNDIVRVIHNWRFVQTAQVDTSVRSGEAPQSVFDSTLEYIVAHEIGHTLGFMHNMAASAAIPVDSLRSPTFTAKHGTTASIMDYARFNYVAQPEDKGVHLEPPFLGVYDYFLIDWTYRPFDFGGDYYKEAEALRALVAKHEGDPFYRHGVQQFDMRLDPSAIEEDLSDDPIKASDYGFKNLKYILDHLDRWITDDDTTERKQELYGEILGQAFNYIGAVYMNVSGIYLSQTSESSGLPRTKVVPKEEQRASAKWLLEKSLTFSEIMPKDLEDQLYAAGNRSYQSAEDYIRVMAVSSGTRLGITHYFDQESYSPMEYLEDTYRFVFKKTLSGDERVTEEEKALQNAFVNTLAGAAEAASKNTLTANFKEFAAISLNPSSILPRTKIRCSSPLCQDSHSHHSEYTIGSFGEGYGFPEHLWTAAINRSVTNHFHYALKVAELLEQAVKTTADSTLRDYYGFLLNKIMREIESK